MLRSCAAAAAANANARRSLSLSSAAIEVRNYFGYRESAATLLASVSSRPPRSSLECTIAPVYHHFGWRSMAPTITFFTSVRAFSTNASNGSSRDRRGNAYPKLEELNFRAKAKLRALEEAKKKRKDAKRAYEASRYDDEMLNDNESTTELSTLFDEWLESERVLSLAYQQAVKYVARTRDADAALNAQKMLEEMIERAGAPPTEHPLDVEIGSTAASSTKLKLQVMVKMIDERGQDREGVMPDISNVPFPPPERKDFMNVLRSWCQSKARRKGLYAEALLLRMAELAYWYPDIFDTLPVSKTFSIVVQCHAGSTHSQSLKKVAQLNAIHSVYAQNNVSGIHRDDPFLLMASLKALKNYRKREELELGEMWLSRLHSFVVDPSNAELFVSENKEVYGNTEESDGGAEQSNNAGDELPSAQKFISVSSAYVKHIRELARLRGMDGAPAMARTALDQMQEVAAEPKNFVFMDVKVNAYNLVIGLYRDSKHEGYTTEAVYLLDKMIASWKQREDEPDSVVPLPNEHSFAFVLQSLAYMKDAKAFLEESRRLLDEYESLCDDGVVETSTKPYNAALSSMTVNLRNDPSLLSHISEVIVRMNERSERYPEVEPDVKTSAFVLKACSLVSGDEAERSVAFATAKRTFEELEEREKEGDVDSHMTDRCYFQMMRCVTNLVRDQDEKHTEIKVLFANACRKGLCSADILKVFHNTVSEEDYTTTVGTGRLADTWVANVNGGKALYTDGTTGGKGKHARRKGKSTSDWAKKQRIKETEHRLRKEAKAEKKERRKKRQAAAMS